MFVDYYDILRCIGNSVDLISPEVTAHHQQVAYLSYQIGQNMGLDKQACGRLLAAGLLHDIGALSGSERLRLIEEEPFSAGSHAFRSASLLEEAMPLKEQAEIVRYHHLLWENGEGRMYQGRSVPFESHILHLADRVCVKFSRNFNAIEQVPGVFSKIENDIGYRFMPEAVEALKCLKRKDHVWLELMEQDPLDYLPVEHIFSYRTLNVDEILQVTHMLSYIIDFRSHFTATHSAGVAAVAERLGKLFGFSETESKMLIVAGYLHDLGKLSIPNELLEKPTALSDDEFRIIRGHTFYTYRLLGAVRGFETIQKWAAYHHERLDGNGYPFRLNADKIPLGSRIMSVADVFTSISEDRPYRKGMPSEKIRDVLRSMVDAGALCNIVVNVLLDNLNQFIAICRTSQKSEAEAYEKFSAVS